MPTRRTIYSLLALALLAGACQIERIDPDAATAEDTSSAVPNPDPVNPPAVRERRPAPPDAAPEDQLLIPVTDVGPAELEDTFTAARGAGRPHDAIDIMAPRGRPVVAAASGEVLRLFESEPGGTTLYKRGLDGRTIFYYAHLEAYHPAVQEGDFLAQGDTLGFVGDSGNAPPGVTHLHFAIWLPEDPDNFWEGEAINPYPLLQEGLTAPAGN